MDFRGEFMHGLGPQEKKMIAELLLLKYSYKTRFIA